MRGATPFARAMELFTVARSRRALYASQMVMLAQQMCGASRANGHNAL